MDVYNCVAVSVTSVFTVHHDTRRYV